MPVRDDSTYWEEPLSTNRALYGQTIRDQELGRWRDPTRPQNIVYRGETESDGQIPFTFINELTGNRDEIFIWPHQKIGKEWIREDAEVCDEFEDTIFNYFQANPLEDVWHGWQPFAWYFITLNDNRELLAQTYYGVNRADLNGIGRPILRSETCAVGPRPYDMLLDLDDPRIVSATLLWEQQTGPTGPMREAVTEDARQEILNAETQNLRQQISAAIRAEMTNDNQARANGHNAVLENAARLAETVGHTPLSRRTA